MQQVTNIVSVHNIINNEEINMNNIVTTIMTASLLTASFSIYAEDSSIDDGYHNEGFSSYDIPASSSPSKSFVVSLDDAYRNEGFTSYDITASSSPGKSFVVSVDDAYRNEGFTSYDQKSIDQHSIEGTVISVAAVAAVK